MKLRHSGKSRNITAAVALALAVSAQATGTVYADVSTPAPSESAFSLDISNLQEKQEVGSFTKFHGEVTDIRESGENIIIRLEAERENAKENEDEKEIFDFVADKNSVIVSYEDFMLADDVKIGDKFTVFYILPQFMTMIYPPQLTASVFVKDAESGIESVMVSYFDADLLSADKQLKLNVNTENPILDKNGEAYTGSLEDKVLVVFSAFMTMSIPAQTSPTKIIVLDIDKEALKDALPTPAPEPTSEPSPEPTDTPLHLLIRSNVDGMAYFVNEKHIEAPSAFVDDNGVAMVPLRALAEAMGYTVTWDADYREVRLGVAITATVDKDYYTIGRAAPIELGTAPVIKYDRVFVPVSFFKEVVKAGLRFDENAFYFESLTQK